MIPNKQAQPHTRFRTGARLALTSAALLSLAAAAGCKSDDTSNDAAAVRANANAARPTVTVTQTRPTPAPAAPSDKLPAEVMNWEIKSVDGKTFRLADYGDKVVVLDLWATWCGPCRYEIPHLVELSKDYEGKGVEVVGLTTENPEQAEELVRDFMREYKINYRIGWSPRDLSLALMRGNTSIPQTFVIAPGGRVVAHYRGYSDTLPKILRAAVDKATESASGD